MPDFRLWGSYLMLYGKERTAWLIILLKANDKALETYSERTMCFGILISTQTCALLPVRPIRKSHFYIHH